MEPLKITFHLKTSVVESAHPIHLDDLLSWAVVQEQEGDFRDIQLPLAEEKGVYKASALEFDSILGVNAIPRIRRLDPKLFISGFGTLYKPRGRKLRTAGGKTRNFMLTHNVFYSPEAHAWCIGDRERIEYLLNTYLQYVGPMAKLGHGEIKYISVEPSHEATDNWKRRALPWCPDEDSYEPMQIAVRPPYWKIENLTQGWIHRDII